jgi:hypothetical protein
MGDLFAILLGCLGTTWIIKYGSILEPIRERLFEYSFFQKLMTCAMCSGWWVGLFWQFFIDKPLWFHLMMPFISSGFCYGVDNAFSMMVNFPGIVRSLRDETSSEVQKEP